MSSFVHLRSRSCYSVGQGLPTPEEIAAEAARLGMPAVGLADRGTLAGIPRLMAACAALGIRPIPGIVVRAAADGKEAEVCALAAGEQGLRSLVVLHDLAAGERVRGGRILSAGDLALPGLVLLVGPPEGTDEASQDLLRAVSAFDGVEAFLACRTADEVPPRLAALRAVAVPDPLFLRPGAHREQALLHAISTHGRFDETSAARNADRWFQDAAAVEERFAGFPPAVRRAAELGECLGVDPSLVSLFAGSRSAAPGLADRARAGLEARLPAGADGDAYRTRLEGELREAEAVGVLGDLEAAEAVVRVAAEDGVRKGPGRGSTCCSLLAWALGLTDVDPVACGLPASRFLHWEARPHVEVDFAPRPGEMPLQRRRGATTPSGAVFLGVMRPWMPKDRALAVHANRAMGTEYRGNLSRGEAVPDATGGLAASLATFPCFAMWHEHAAWACAVPPDALLPRGRDQGDAVAMFDRETLRTLGLPVVGVLELAALADLEALEPGPGDRDADADAARAAFARGDVTGLMPGDRERAGAFLARARPSSREDLAAIRAMDHRNPSVARDWLERREGLRRPKPPHPLLRGATADTFGLLLFQEQVIEAVAEICRLKEADACLLARGLTGRGPVSAEVFERAALAAGRTPGDAAGVRAALERFAPDTSCRGHALACATASWDLAVARERGREAWTRRRTAAFARDSERLQELLRDPEAEPLLRRYGVI